MVHLTLPEPAKADLTPMADVTFLLLAFFVATLNFSRLEGQVDAALPKSICSLGVCGSAENQNVVMLVADPAPESRRVRYEVGDRSFRSLSQLAAYLRTLEPESTRVSIDPRRGVVVQEVVSVLDAVRQCGFEEVSFAGTFEND